MDPVLTLTAAAAAGGLAAAVTGLAGCRSRAAAAGTVVAVAAGFGLGAWLLGPRPAWPPTDVVGRWLLAVVPAAAGIETLGAGRRGWPWILRLALAAFIAPVLLFGTVYVSDAAGAGSRLWSGTRIGVTYGVVAAGLLAVWSTVLAVADHRQARPATLALGFIVFAAGIAVAVSGYATGGLLGVPLAAALMGATFANLRSSDPGTLRNAAGFATVGLFALVLVGHWFGSLGVRPAMLLLASPVALAVLRLPVVAGRSGWARAMAAILAVGLPVAGAIIAALCTFADEAKPSAPDGGPTFQDYINFGK